MNRDDVRILIVDDISENRAKLKQDVESLAGDIDEAADGKTALDLHGENRYDLIILDINLGNDKINGIEVLKRIREGDKTTPVVMLTVRKDLASIIKSRELNADDFIIRPYFNQRLRVTLENAIKLGWNKRERDLDLMMGRPLHIVHQSEGMKSVLRQAYRAAQTNEPVLITGDTGTGKEVVAEFIHRHSIRCYSKYVITQLGTFAESIYESEIFGHAKGAFTGADADRPGRFEIADGGTLFLDEISELTPNLQTKLLRVVETGQFSRLGENTSRSSDFKLVSATNKNLSKMIKNGTFREDLFYRLAVIRIHIPPLLERREDIIPLAEYFLNTYCAEQILPPMHISDRAKAKMLMLPWNGNARDIRACIINAAITCDESGNSEIHPDHIRRPALGTTPDQSKTRLRSLDSMIDEYSYETVLKALDQTNDNKSEAARLLEISRTRLHRILNYKRHLDRN